MDKKLASTIGAAARAARMRLELTQADVAERIEVATEVYGRLERGGMLPSVQTLLRLCNELNVSADELLGLSNHGTSTRSSSSSTAEAPSLPTERPEIRRLLRSMRQLDSSHIKLLGLVAKALLRR